MEDMARAVAGIASVLPRKKTATVLALSGELGAGKTTFVQLLGKQLGVSEHITSPTFVVMKQYPVAGHDWVRTLVHVDAYRIEDIDEIRVLRLAEILSKPETILCIEWPERIKSCVPDGAFHVSIALNADGSRTMRYDS